MSGGKNPTKTVNSKTIPLEQISLIPNKQTYEDGEEGEVLGKKQKIILKYNKMKNVQPKQLLPLSLLLLALFL